MKFEMAKLYEKCKVQGIPCELTIQPNFNTPQLCFPDISKRDGDVICHKYSYGGPEGLLETLGFGEDDVIGYLNAEQAFEIILNYYKEKEEENNDD